MDFEEKLFGLIVLFLFLALFITFQKDSKSFIVHTECPVCHEHLFIGNPVIKKGESWDITIIHSCGQELEIIIYWDGRFDVNIF